MTLRGWHITRGEDRVLISRAPHPRFDVWAEARFPECDPFRLALQIRQDLWRRLQRVRGFRPVVSVDRGSGGLTARAGGELAVKTTIPATVSENIVDLLADPDNRRRWVTWASPDGSRRGQL